MRRRVLLSACAALVWAPPLAFGQETPSPPAPSPPAAGIGIELNKLEQVETSCRAYFVVTNGTKETIEELGLDVFVFDRDKVITRRVGLTFDGVRPDRRKVVLFDLESTSCVDVAELMVNDVLGCKAGPATGAEQCRAMIATSSRAGATFSY